MWVFLLNFYPNKNRQAASDVLSFLVGIDVHADYEYQATSRRGL